jgi:hypothetical protein
VVKTIYDPACGTGGMLSVSENYIRQLNLDAHPKLFGQDWNDEVWAVCKSDMLIKGEDADNIVRDDTFTRDGFERDAEGKKRAFDYMLANPPFGVEWKQQQTPHPAGIRHPGLCRPVRCWHPAYQRRAFLFLQHMISKMRAPEAGGSRIGIVFNGSPLFTGDAGSGESNIRPGEPEAQPVARRIRNLGALIEATAEGRLKDVCPEVREDQVAVCFALVTGPGGPDGKKGYPWSCTKGEPLEIDFKYLKRKAIQVIPSAMTVADEGAVFKSDGTRVAYLNGNVTLKDTDRRGEVAERLRQKLLAAFDKLIFDTEKINIH